MANEIINKIIGTDKNIIVGVAGPGTGKSFTFQEIIESPKYRDKKVLILSFINRLVDDLQRDFRGFKNVEVGTLHSFAASIVSKERDGFEFKNIIDNIISEDFCILNSNQPYNYTEAFQDNKIDGQHIIFYKDRKGFYEEKNKKLYSFNSMVYALNVMFEKNNNKIPKYDLILIDEFQDFNALEWKTIELLSFKNKIVVVGDDDQSLYDFKNAKPEIIRNLYNNDKYDNFTLPNCYRCTKVVVGAVNDVINTGRENGLLSDRIIKNYLYASGRDEKDKVSDQYPVIEYKQVGLGHKLYYDLSKKIDCDIGGQDKKRILVLIPKYMHRSLIDGLGKKGFNPIEVELFDRQKGTVVDQLSAFQILNHRKTDDLALRCVLKNVVNTDRFEDIIRDSSNGSKPIWSLLGEDERIEVERVIGVYNRGVKNDATQEQKINFIKEFDIKIPLKLFLDHPIKINKDNVEVEIMNVLNSKGLSADFVYYFIDDKYMCEKDKLNDSKLCEFIVGITRAKEKLTLLSSQATDPKILNFIQPNKIQRL